MSSSLDRRSFFAAAGTCTGWILLAAASPATAARIFAPARRIVDAQQPWGRLERIADGVWAMISTPLVDHPDARRTLCNGGIIAGTDGVMIVEAFGSDEGAAWMAAEARRLTGRPATHVVVTHYHGDHCNGLHGFGTDDYAPATMATPTTRALVEQRSRLPAERKVLPDARIMERAPATVDLGGRIVTLAPVDGHTPSDVFLRVDDPAVVFCGDLVWNGMFPNYVDAVPPRLAESVSAIGAEPDVVYVPGHGTLADADDMRTYAALLDDVGAAARRAIDAGRPLDEAAAEYRLPAVVADWILFSPQYFRVAFEAWSRSVGG